MGQFFQKSINQNRCPQCFCSLFNPRCLELRWTSSLVLETALYLQSAHLNGLRSALVVDLASSRGSLLPTKGIYYQLQTKGGISLGAFDCRGGGKGNIGNPNQIILNNRRSRGFLHLFLEISGSLGQLWHGLGQPAVAQFNFSYQKLIQQPQKLMKGHTYIWKMRFEADLVASGGLYMD